MQTKNNGNNAKPVLSFQKEKEMKKSYLLIAIALVATLLEADPKASWISLFFYLDSTERQKSKN